jgi:hypothetical protein
MLPKNEIRAVISLPRLVYTDHMFSTLETLPHLNISVARGCGVFWGQVLTRLIEYELEHKPKYILTLDYDTWYTTNHVLRLYQIMEENPDYDAVIPLQSKRNGTGAMMALNYGQKSTEVEKDYFRKDVSEVQGGHFGLTLFRASAFDKIAKPWFLPEPDEEGRWGEDKVDEDIYFWKNFSKVCKAGIANDVSIGHMQMICSFCGPMENGWKPEHVNMKDLSERNLPEWAKPRISDAFKKELARRINQGTTGVRKAKRRRSKVK